MLTHRKSALSLAGLLFSESFTQFIEMQSLMATLWAILGGSVPLLFHCRFCFSVILGDAVQC